MSSEHHSGKQVSYHVRMILLGEAGAGKSCLFHRIKYKTFRDDSDPASIDNNTRGGASVQTRQLYDSYATNVKLSDGTRVSFSVYDTAGRERFQSMTAQYYKHINLVLLVCSADSEFTLTKLAKWHAEAKNYIDDTKVTYALCITKCDLPDRDREVRRTEIDSFAAHCSIHQKHIFEVSAKSGDKVLHMIKTLCAAVVESYKYDRYNDSIAENSEVSSLLLSSSSAGGVSYLTKPTPTTTHRRCCVCCVLM